MHQERQMNVVWYSLVLGLVGLLSSTLFAVSTPDKPQQFLLAAVNEYQAAMETSGRGERLRRFERAESLFARLTDGDFSIQNADLYTNQGNAALQAERLGPAVLAYRRALCIDPDHQRAHQNLEHARTLLPEWVPRVPEGGVLDTFFGWSQNLSQRERSLLAALLFLSAAILLAAAVRWRNSLLRYVGAIPAIVWLLLLTTYLFSQDDQATRHGVIVSHETVARAADAVNAPPRFGEPLPGGTEVRIEERREDWTHIRLGDGRTAWVRSSSLALVRGG